jgi:hypothetical protein
MILTLRFKSSVTLLLAMAVFLIPQAAHAGFSLGAASNYAVLFEGAGSGTLSYNTFVVNGNFGIGGTGNFAISGGGTVINGNIDFSASNTGQLTGFSSLETPPTPVVTYNVAAVTSALNTVNTLSTSLGSEAGTNIAITNGTVINASDGTLDANGNRVFDVTSFSSNSGNTITIDGDAAGDSVVLNFTAANGFNSSSGIHFDSGVILDGISADQVLYNFSGGSTLNIVANNQHGNVLTGTPVQGIFLDPNGTGDQINNSAINGRIFGGDSSDMHIVSGGVINQPATATPEPRNVSLLLSALVAIGLIVARKKNLIRS